MLARSSRGAKPFEVETSASNVVEVEGTLFIQPKSSEIRQILCTSKRIQKSSSSVQRVDKDQNTTVRISYGAHAGDDVNEMLQFDLL